MNVDAFHPEDIARSAVDRRLAECGWFVQSRDAMNLGAGLGIAVREFQTASGPVDYALFVGRRLCGVVEAKTAGTTLSGFAEQAARYIADMPSTLIRSAGQVRFEYVASSTEILFRDHADPAPASRRVFAFHRPETLARRLGEAETLRARLRSMPALIVDGLRACQVDAVSAIEASLAAGHPRALVQMATGAGKTFTACTLAHRLLAHAGFERILFLADRANLVRQTRDEFLAYRPPGTGRSFSELYNVQKLGPGGVDRSAQVVVATIQRVYSALSGTPLDEADEEASGFEVPVAGGERIVGYAPNLPIESFDLVITDECHRSIYGTWRQVLDYFDAFTLGLTATPSLHTMGFFNRNLVAQYPYERSVVDGVNVGFEIFRIRTEIGERGSTVAAGYDLPVRDKRTRAERWERLEDDFAYAPTDLDRTVVVPNQIRTVIETFRASLFTDLFPGRTEVPKTLIFAKDDHHAEEIVGIVRDVFGKGNDFAKKITYKTDGGDPETLIKAFRNDYLPRIAVTVDMIATGTDVKPLEALIFLRDVRSDLYFEQMKGRGARTISVDKLRAVTPDAEAKTRFVLVDAVGVTESLKMIAQPLERQRAVSFDRLIDEIAAGRRDDDAFTTLAARLAALDRRISDRDRGRITSALPGTPAGAKLAFGRALPQEEHGTTHFVTVDRWGHATSYTSTVEGPFGSGLMVGGYYLNNELTDFNIVPDRDGKPTANRVAGGKRPRSSMAPTLVYGPDGALRIAVGAAGGSTIPAQVAKAIIGVIDWNLSARDAIALPTVFAPGGDTVFVEKGTTLEAMIPALVQLGHAKVIVRSPSFKANAIEKVDGTWRGAADPRSEGAAVAP